MNIVVCVKYVPDATADRQFESDNTVDRVGVDGLLSELDEYAVEQALQIKEKAGDDTEVTVESSFFSLSWSACSTAYSSSSESRPGTPTRSTVLSDSKCRSAVASGTYFTQTTMFIFGRPWPGPSCTRDG
jgi:hypothetical protein